MLCVASVAGADPGIRSLQQALKEQGFYYGTVTGEKTAETTTAIRRYQIRNGLQITGELNEETSRSIELSSKSLVTAGRPSPNPAGAQATTVRADAGTGLSQNSRSSSSPSDQAPQANTPYSTSFYQSPAIRVNRQVIAGAQNQLLHRGYYRGAVDGKFRRQMAFALRAFQSRAGLPPTGRLDDDTLEALGVSGADSAHSGSMTGGYESWMPVRKFKDGQWTMTWKRFHRSFANEITEDRQVNSRPEWDPYTQDY
jgi:peptidoglycan hydrolase-like protein with peptidoglycan-binding domain